MKPFNNSYPLQSLIFAIMYFLLNPPRQQKKVKEHKAR